MVQIYKNNRYLPRKVPNIFLIKLHFVKLDLRQGLLDVVEDVLNVLNAYAQTNEVWSHTSLAELFVGELAMGVGGRMEHAGTGIGHVGHDVDHFQ